MSDTTPRNIDQPVDQRKFDDNWDAIDWEEEERIAENLERLLVESAMQTVPDVHRTIFVGDSLERYREMTRGGA